MLAVSLLALVGVAAAAPTKQLWLPSPGTSWQIVLSQSVKADEVLKTDAQAYDLDMENTDKSTIDALHAKGKKVICYFSAGSYEPYRSDSSQFQSSDLGSVMDGWPDEKWLKTGSANVRKIMSARIATAASKGCDAIDPDNVDGYSNSNGAGLTEASAVDYVKFLAQQASSNGMSIGLKNAGDIVPKVINDVQFSVNEQCHEYSECSTYEPFVTAGKAVFNIEYPGSVTGQMKLATTDSSCYPNADGANGFSTVLKNLALDVSIKECGASPGYENAEPKSAPASSPPADPPAADPPAPAPKPTAKPPPPPAPKPTTTTTTTPNAAPATPIPPPPPGSGSDNGSGYGSRPGSGSGVAPPRLGRPGKPVRPIRPVGQGSPSKSDPSKSSPDSFPSGSGAPLPGRPGRPAFPGLQSHRLRKGSFRSKQFFDDEDHDNNDDDNDEDNEDNEDDEDDSGDDE